jgi:uncharacterized protein YxjI
MQYVIRETINPLNREMMIEDRHGKSLFRVHGPVVRLRDELRFDDAAGVEQAWIKEPVLGDRKTFEIYRGEARAAVIRMVAVGNLLEGFDVDISGATAVHARGDMYGREFTLSGPGGVVARVHRHDGNAIECETAFGQDDVMLLAGIVAMGAMTDIWARAGTRRG